MLHAIEKKDAIREYQYAIINYRMTVLGHDFPDYHKEQMDEAREELTSKFSVRGEELYCAEDEANDAFDALVDALTGDEDGEYERLENYRKRFPHFSGLSHNWATRELIRGYVLGENLGEY